jgi:hypothetical protein
MGFGTGHVYGTSPSYRRVRWNRVLAGQRVLPNDIRLDSDARVYTCLAAVVYDSTVPPGIQYTPTIGPVRVNKLSNGAAATPTRLRVPAGQGPWKALSGRLSVLAHAPVW